MKKLIFTIITLFVCIQVYAQEGNHANVNGVNIYYEVYGEGEPLVFLHGFAMSHEMWNDWIEDMSQNHKLFLVDLRGRGRSTNPSNHFTHKESAKDIYGLMDALQIETFKAIGFSSGGMILTHMAAMDPTRIEAMVLIGSTSYFPEQAREIQRATNYESINEDFLSTLKQWHPGGEQQIRSLLAEFRNMANNYEDVNFTPPYLSSIKTPTLIIHGDRDPFFSVNIPVSSFQSMPNSYLWIIPNFGHSRISKESLWADPFLKTVNQFFSGNWDK